MMMKMTTFINCYVIITTRISCFISSFCLDQGDNKAQMKCSGAIQEIQASLDQLTLPCIVLSVCFESKARLK